MAQALVNTGTFPNDTTGDPLQLAFQKVNANFTELYADSPVLLTAVKPSTQTLASSTVLTNDTALTLSLPIGRFALQAFLNIANVAGATGFKFAFAFTGTLSNGAYAQNGWINGAVTAAALQNPVTNVTSYATTDTSGDWVEINASFLVTVAGTLTLQWAQNSSSASLTSMLQGSWLVANNGAG